MKTVVIDYGQAGSAAGAFASSPARRSGKFLVLRNDDTEYLVFSPLKLTPYHSNLLERFCRERGLKGSYDSERKRYSIEEPPWVVEGGGKFTLDAEDKTIRLYDDSMAYGKFNPSGLREKLLRIKGLTGYRLQIE